MWQETLALVPKTSKIEPKRSISSMKLWHPPRKPDYLPVTNLTWPRLAFALHQMATTGLAVRFELAKTLGEYYDLAVKSKSVRYTFQRLSELKLIHTEIMLVVNSYEMAVVRLSDEGRELCQQFGWEPVENEWERMMRLHSGGMQTRHTAAVLSMAYQARLRGWKTQVVPSINHPSVFPDLVIEKADQRIFVEVELRHTKLNKWRNVHTLQGFVALCARTAKSRETLVQECRNLNIPVIAADLLSLARVHREADPGPLWLEAWKKQITP